MNQDVLENAPCDLCASSEHRVLLRKKDTSSYWLAKCAEDASLDSETEFQIVECAGCKHVFVSPRLKPEINADIYERFWKSYEPQAFRPDEFAEHLSRQLAELTRLGKLLDFGCGWGHYLSAAQTTGWDAVGIEVDTAKIDFAKKHGLNVIQADLLDCRFQDSAFDAVIAQQVFEHLYDPVKYLVEINRVLKPGGVLFVGVPNFGGLPARLGGAQWAMISPVAHVRYFTRATLGQLLTDHGFEVIKKRYVRRFTGGLKNVAFQSSVALENVLGLYLRDSLSLYARKK